MRFKKKYSLARYKWLFTSLEVEKEFIKLNRKKLEFEKDNSIVRVKYILAFFVLLLSFVRVFYIYIKQYFIVHRATFKIKSVMLDTGRGYELNNMYKITETGIVIQAFVLADFMKYKKVGILALMKALFNSFFDFYHVLSLRIPNHIILLIIKTGLKNISIYSYLISFFIALRKTHSGLIVYVDGALLPAYASIDSQVQTVRTFHGLMDFIHPDAFPDYDITYVYSLEECKYIKDIGIKTKTKVYSRNFIKHREDTVVFFMSEDVALVSISNFYELVTLFQNFDYKIIIKPHPLSMAPDSFKKEYNLYSCNWYQELNLSSVEYFLKKSDANVVISEQNPSFVVGWGSTSLCEALRMNVMPISMSIDNSSVYPINKKSLLWPLKKSIVEAIISDPVLYKSEINKLRLK